jgi:hypothetical protein
VKGTLKRRKRTWKQRKELLEQFKNLKGVVDREFGISADEAVVVKRDRSRIDSQAEV